MSNATSPQTEHSPALAGKVAIVTGAGHGTGAAVARALAAAGARVTVNDLNPDRASRVAAEIRAGGGEAIDVMGDVSNKYQCVHVIETTRAEWGQLDIVVNAAAIRPVEPLLKMDEWEWTRVLDVNLKGVFFMSQLTGRVMGDENRARGGLIVNLLRPVPEGAVAFAASQSAVAGFSRACAAELAPLNIRVLTLDTAADPDATAAAVLRLC